MRSKSVLMTLRQREMEFLDNAQAGSEEYIAAQKRLISIEGEIFKREQAEEDAVRKQKESKSERRRRICNSITESVDVAGKIALPVFGIVAVIAAERDIVFGSALKDIVKCFIPKR